MDFSRRSFLVGAGAIITASFVGTAQTFARKTGEPYLLSELSMPQVLYACPTFNDEYPERFHLALGKPQCEPSYVPTWREFLKLEGVDETDESGWQFSTDWEISKADLRRPMNEYTWQCSWNCRYSPSARAVRMLEELDLHRSTEHRAIGGLEFTEGQYPGSFDRWVEADNALSVSLLQARLRELRAPVEVRLGELR